MKLHRGYDQIEFGEPAGWGSLPWRWLLAATAVALVAAWHSGAVAISLAVVVFVYGLPVMLVAFLLLLSARAWCQPRQLRAIRTVFAACGLLMLSGVVSCAGFGPAGKEQRACRPVIAALEAYQQDHGEPAPALDALVPDYLAVLPASLPEYTVRGRQWQLAIEAYLWDGDGVPWYAVYDATTRLWTEGMWTTTWEADQHTRGGGQQESN